MPTGKIQQRGNNSRRCDKMLRYASGSQVKLEGPHCHEEEANWAESKKKLSWLLGRKSQLSIAKKLLVYKTIIKPIWTYGIEIWGCASKSSEAILQKAQSKILRMITNAPWYVSDLNLHEDLKIPYVLEVVFDKYAKHHQKLEMHSNP